MSQLYYRRSALKLIARARRHGKNVAPVAVHVVPLLVLTSLASVVWVGVAIARAGFSGEGVVNATPIEDADAVNQQRGEQPDTVAARAAAAMKRDAIVYVADPDEEYFHAASHAGDGPRRAISIDRAKCRGFRPCPICCKGAPDGLRATVNRN